MVSNLKLVDAHIHLSDPQYTGHTDMLIDDAKNSGLVALVSNAMDYATSVEALKLREKNPELIHVALGIHPWNVNILKEGELEETISLITEQHQLGNVLAIGEIGLDCKYESIWEHQLMVFDRMLRLAEKLGLPAIIHSRGTTEFIVDMLPSYNLKRVLLHWFSHPMTALYKAMEHGYYITEGPPTVYSTGIREVVTNAPLTNLLTETDGPVLFRKAPFNGQMTRPSFVREVVHAIADVKGLSVETVADQIVRNFEVFFNVKLI
ncbi:MAG: TatD family hydrolase [Candidatus Bathyarchaeota archaeon]|nr:TatD family hydrolase [Candidatus Bathyarchaeota archaeon]